MPAVDVGAVLDAAGLEIQRLRLDLAAAREAAEVAQSLAVETRAELDHCHAEVDSCHARIEQLERENATLRQAVKDAAELGPDKATVRLTLSQLAGYTLDILADGAEKAGAVSPHGILMVKLDEEGFDCGMAVVDDPIAFPLHFLYEELGPAIERVRERIGELK